MPLVVPAELCHPGLRAVLQVMPWGRELVGLGTQHLI